MVRPVLTGLGDGGHLTARDSPSALQGLGGDVGHPRLLVDAVDVDAILELENVCHLYAQLIEDSK